MPYNQWAFNTKCASKVELALTADVKDARPPRQRFSKAFLVYLKNILRSIISSTEHAFIQPTSPHHLPKSVARR